MRLALAYILLLVSCGGSGGGADCQGACGDPTPLCQDGTCVAACAPGRERCGVDCVDTDTDRENCGRCGHACAPGAACAGGLCEGECAGMVCGGVCVDTMLDPEHCGSCTGVCDGAAPLCVAGACAATCGALAECDGACADTERDPRRCGSCDNDCGPDGTCDGGQCICGGTTTDCGSYCADTRADPKNCGGCNRKCDGDQMCQGSECVCRPGLVIYGSECIDPASDPRACGPGAVACADPTRACQGGACVASCTGGLTECDEACVDMDADPLHCGECGKRCEVDKVCAGGECRDFEVALGCTACPCAACAGDEDLCCSYPGTTMPICVEANACF